MNLNIKQVALQRLYDLMLLPNTRRNWIWGSEWKKARILLLVVCCLSLAACSGGGGIFCSIFGCDDLTSFEIDTELFVEAGIDDETIDLVRDINSTGGLQGGLNEANLQRVDKVNTIMEIIANNGAQVGINDPTRETLEETIRELASALKVAIPSDWHIRTESSMVLGLDEPTRQTVQEGIEALREAPASFEHAITEVIRELGEVGTDSAKEVSEYLIDVLDNATANILQIETTFGKELRCNAEYADSTIRQALGNNLLTKLKNLILLDAVPNNEATTAPTICHLSPQTIQLVDRDGVYFPYDPSDPNSLSEITLIGFDFSSNNLPRIHLLDRSGSELDFPLIAPLPQGAFQMNINLIGLTFDSVPDGSVLKIDWPEGEFVSVALRPPTLPTLTPTPTSTATPENTPTPLPQAPMFIITEARANVRNGPGTVYTWVTELKEGDQARILGKTSAVNDVQRIWYQIELNGQKLFLSEVLGKVENPSNVEIPLVPRSEIPPVPTPIPPTATPTMPPTDTPVPPTITPRPPTRVPTKVQRTQRVTPGTSERFCPNHVRGDREFDGNGPNVAASVELFRAGNGELWARLYLFAEETRSDWSTAEGRWERLLYTPPSGFEVIDVLSDTSSKISYRDNGHSEDVFTLPGELIREFRTKGDTKGDDIGNCTLDDVYLIVTFSSIDVVIREK